MKRLLVIALLVSACGPALRAQVVIISHPEVSINSIDARTLVEIYTLARTEWKDGNPVRVFALRKGTSGLDRFHAYLGIDELALKKTWLRLQLTGEGRAPTVVGEEEMVRRVSETPGAIGFIDISRVTSDVKVLRQVGQ
jgi:ABC-type phosphate transport system substrate-binding protein